MHPKKMREIVKKFYNKNEYSIREVALIFSISKSTIQRWIVDNTPIKIKIDYKEQIDKIIKNVIDNNPFITINQIRDELEKQLKIKISLTGTYVHVKRNNFSFKKVSKRMYKNLKEIKNEVKKFRKLIKTIKVADIVCLDESGIKEDMCENYGWSKKGKNIINLIQKNTV